MNSLWKPGWLTGTVAGGVMEGKQHWANWHHKPPACQKSALEFQAVNQDICIPSRAGQLFIPVLGGD